jgi:hypothetical protein
MLTYAEALYNASSSMMAQEVGMLESLTDPGNAEQWESFEAEVSKKQSPVSIQPPTTITNMYLYVCMYHIIYIYTIYK